MTIATAQRVSSFTLGTLAEYRPIWVGIQGCKTATNSLPRTGSAHE